MVIRPSDWAEFQSSRALLSAAEYRRVRRLAGRGLKRNAATLYREAGAVVVAPKVESTAVEGVHLAPASQAQYNAQVVRGIARVLCRDCRLPQLYLKCLYRSILEDTVCQLRPPQVRMTMVEVCEKMKEAEKKERQLIRRKTAIRVSFAAGL